MVVRDDAVKEVFSRLAAGELGQAASPVEDGWNVALPSGRRVARSTLQSEARSLIELGRDAVPYLLPWIMNENPALRYVAIYSLQQITGQNPYLAYFDQTNQTNDRARAIEVWRNWYETTKA